MVHFRIHPWKREIIWTKLLILGGVSWLRVGHQWQPSDSSTSLPLPWSAKLLGVKVIVARRASWENRGQVHHLFVALCRRVGVGQTIFKRSNMLRSSSTKSPNIVHFSSMEESFNRKVQRLSWHAMMFVRALWRHYKNYETFSHVACSKCISQCTNKLFERKEESSTTTNLLP